MSDSQHTASQRSTAAKARKAGAQTGAESSSASTQHPLIALQRMIGNRAVTQMLGAVCRVGYAVDKHTSARADHEVSSVRVVPYVGVASAGLAGASTRARLVGSITNAPPAHPCRTSTTG